VTAQTPDATTRWRCAGCGNLTRFDVARTRSTVEYWHFDLAGHHEVEESLGKLAVFGGVHDYPTRVKCASLAWHALRAALGGAQEPVSTE
jgi:hypothetical protein